MADRQFVCSFVYLVGQMFVLWPSQRLSLSARYDSLHFHLTILVLEIDTLGKDAQQSFYLRASETRDKISAKINEKRFTRLPFSRREESS